MKKISYIGYHATSSQAYQNILVNQKFKESENYGEVDYTADKIKYHWLGKGVYFWDNDIEMAKLWAKSSRTREVIVKVAINCLPDGCFNLNIHSHGQMIEEVIGKLMRVHHIRDFENLQDKQKRLYPLIGVVIDYLFDRASNMPYKMVYYSFNIPSSTSQFLDRVTPQICVKSQDIIEFETMEACQLNGKVVDLSSRFSSFQLKKSNNKKAKKITVNDYNN